MEGIIQNQQIRKRSRRDAYHGTRDGFFPPALVLAEAAGRIGRRLGRLDAFTFAAVGSAVLIAVAVFSGSGGESASPVRIPAAMVSLPRDEALPGLLAGFIGGTADSRPDEGAGAELPPTVFTSMSWRSYTVRRGDSVSVIAARAGVSMDTIISFNRIGNARGLQAGTALRVPNMDGLLYTVRRGDSLSGIAAAHSAAINDILDANNLATAVIHPGQELFIPGAKLREMELKRILGEMFAYPISGRLTSTFGMRNDPFTGVRRFHNGIDLAAPLGTGIGSAMAGKVAMVGTHPSYGRYVILQHQDGYQTWYAHLNRSLVVRGQWVAQGQKIGEVGNTGYSTGPHLHFSVFRKGEPVDPLRFLY